MGERRAMRTRCFARRMVHRGCVGAGLSWRPCREYYPRFQSAALVLQALPHLQGGHDGLFNADRVAPFDVVALGNITGQARASSDFPAEVGIRP